jgi:hypothetical protein
MKNNDDDFLDYHFEVDYPNDPILGLRILAIWVVVATLAFVTGIWFL